MTINLTGMNGSNKLNLTGKTECLNPIINKMNILKKNIIKNYILPVYSDKWDVLIKNSLLINETIAKLNNYYNHYKLEDLKIYIEFLKIIKIVLEKNEQLNEYESQVNYKKEKNYITSMIYKTTKIVLLPEYEIYNSIIGKPKRSTNEKYDENIINEIVRLIKREDITYDKIKTIVENKYL